MPVVLNGKYTLGRTLGSGASCKVKLAKDDSGRRYAVKILNNNEDFEEMIQTELDALTQLAEHPNIVQLIEVGKGYQLNPSKGQKMVNYIVLELVSGGELFDFVSLGGRFSENEGRYYFKQLLDGLNHVHSHGYAHRDLKCENLLLDASFTLKISDFGLSAPLAGRDNNGLMETTLGTFSFMAPEIHMKMPYEGKKVDLFAAAIVLFTMISQRPPFESAHRTDPHYRLIATAPDQFWAAHKEADEGTDMYSAEFKDLFGKMMQVSPNKRPSLEEILAHPWLQMAMPSQEEITTEFEKRKALLDAEAKKDRAEKKDQQARDAQERVVRRAGAGDYADDGGQAAAQQPREHPWEQLEVQEYGPLYQQSFTQFFTTAQPLDVFEHLHEKLNASSTEVSISGSKLKLHFLAEISSDAGESTQARVSVELLSVSDRKHCVKFTYLDPEKKTELSAKFRNGATSHFISYSTDVLKSFNDTTFDEQH